MSENQTVTPPSNNSDNQVNWKREYDAMYNEHKAAATRLSFLETENKRLVTANDELTSKMETITAERDETKKSYEELTGEVGSIKKAERQKEFLSKALEGVSDKEAAEDRLMGAIRRGALEDLAEDADPQEIGTKANEFLKKSYESLFTKKGTATPTIGSAETTGPGNVYADWVKRSGDTDII